MQLWGKQMRSVSILNRLPTFLPIFVLFSSLAAAQESIGPVAIADGTDRMWIPTIDPSMFPADGVDYRIAETPRHVQPLLMQLVLENVPHEYENTKNWGGTREVFDGLHIRTDGLRIRTKRKKKTANHGTWKKYSITLVDPQENLRVRITDLREDAPGHVVFRLLLTAKLEAFGRLQEWNRGIRLFSISADALADVDLSLLCRMTTELDAKHLPPDILLKPEVTEAQLRLRSFRLKRVSKADGPVIRELGDGVADIVRKKLAEKNTELVAKINRQIAKREEDLRLSMRELVTSGIFHMPRNTDSESDG
jgi:hypothetical protein